MSTDRPSVEAPADARAILAALRHHLQQHRVCTLATSRGDAPWAASCFYVVRDLDLFVCQRRDARTLANALANPVVGFAVDDRSTAAWLQGRGRAAPVSGPEEEWARTSLVAVGPEFARHFSNPDYPVLRISPEEFMYVDRARRMRSHLLRRGAEWVVPDET